MAEQPGVVRVREALELIAAALRGEPVASPPPALHATLVQAATNHRVAALLVRTSRAALWNADLLHELRRAAAGDAALAMAWGPELRRLLGIFESHDVRPLLIKGAHLSRTCYLSPACRPHSDVDLLVADGDRSRAVSALAEAGYQPLPHVTGDVAFTQAQFVRTAQSGIRHHVDLHWRICGPRVFAERLTWAELREARVPIPELHAIAAGPSDGHALMLACIHRTAHHANSERLLWLYDIHLLAGRLSKDGWNHVVGSAIDKGIAPIVRDGLAAAQHWLGTAVPPDVLQVLSVTSGDDAATAFLDPAHTSVKVLLSDWHALHGVKLRLRFLREHLLPSPGYMRQKYGTQSSVRLPLLYVQRLVTGARRWL